MTSSTDSDLNDLLKKGLTLKTVIDAALISDPDPVEGDLNRRLAQKKAADIGEETLATLTAEIGRAQGVSDQRELIRQVIESEGLLAALATYHRLSPLRVSMALDRFTDHRGLKTTVSRLEAAIRFEATRQVEGIPSKTSDGDPLTSPDDLTTLLKAGSLPRNLFPPPGFMIDGRGVWRSGKEDWIRIAPAPLLITGIASDIDDGSVSYQVAWKRGEVWCDQWVDASMIAEARKLPGLKRHGAPVTSVSSADLVRYLEAFEAHNIEAIPTAMTSRRMGWIEGGEGAGAGGFLIAGDHLGGEGDVSLMPAPGLDSLSAAFTPRGSLEGWIEAVAQLATRAIPWVAIYAATAAPLVEILDSPNFIVDISGATSGGKTLSARIACSIWGSPDDKGGGLIGSWSDTLNNMEKRAGFLYSLPFVVDESQRAGRSSSESEAKIREVAHSFTAGQGKGRGGLVGIQASDKWRSIMISTGEERLTSFCGAGGVAARIISIEGQPFGEKSEENAAAADAVEAGVMANYGHVGRDLLALLIHNRAQWGELRSMYRRYVADYRTSASGVGHRLAAYVAVLRIAAQLLHDRLDIPRPIVDPLAMIEESVLRSSLHADRASEALIEVFSWAVANEGDFFGRHDQIRSEGGGLIPRRPIKGWAGSWMDSPSWSRLCFRPSVLKSILENLGYRYGALIESWKERGAVVHSSGRNDLSVKIGGKSVKCVVFTRSAIESLIDEETTTSEEGDSYGN